MRNYIDEWYVGIDLGTSSCKCSIITNQGQLLSIGNSKYAGNNLKEQEPNSILRGMIQAVRNALSKTELSPHTCQAVSIGCALHGILAVNKAGKPLTNVYTWASHQAVKEAEQIKNSTLAKNLYQQTGCPPHSMYPLYKIIWIRENQPEIFKKTARFISVKEYIMAELCHEYCIDFSVASGSGMLNIHSLNWDPLALELMQISPNQLSQVVSPKQILPIKNASIAKELGLPIGTPLVIGSSDAANSTLGAGAVDPWQATCMIGTSGAYRIISAKPVLSNSASSWCYCMDEQHWLVGGAINNGGIALAWLRDALQIISSAELSFDQLLDFAQQSQLGSGGVICLPFFAGERSPNWDLNARAAFFGLSIDHDIRHLSRAILEGICFRLRSLDEMLREMSIEIQEVRASGGFTLSDFWVEMLANVLGRSISVPKNGETSCLGASFWAILGMDNSRTFDDLKNTIELFKPTNPQKNAVQEYKKIYPMYKGLYQAVSPFFKKITNPRTSRVS